MNMMISWDLTNEHGELVGFDHHIGGVSSHQNMGMQ